MVDARSESCKKCRANLKKSDTDGGRNLVVSIDGTSNQFGSMNTNVVELCFRLIQDKTQLIYYASGIGTLAKPSWQSYSYWKQCLYNIIDLAIAWNFEKGVQDAYRWLAENYQEGDRIYLFGFSRGAYQVRTLAAMIDRVGLLRKGNQEQVAFAYELYRDDGVNEMNNTSAKSSATNGFGLTLWRIIHTILTLLLNLLVLGWVFSQLDQPFSSAFERYYDGYMPYKSYYDTTAVFLRASPLGARMFELFWICFVWLRIYHIIKRTLEGIIQIVKDFDSRYRRVSYPRTFTQRFGKRLWSVGVQLGLFSLELGPEHDNKDAERFKRTFSREGVRVHFLGAWDTVSSIGVVRGKDLPGTSGDLGHICYFRHALALDERRVKFLPEYAHGATQKEQKDPDSHSEQLRPHIKEVWFSGTHSDIGGGNVYNANLCRRHPAFLWMCYEATLAGLAIKSDDVEWNWEQLGVIHESLSGVWKALEIIPFRRPSYAKMGFNSRHQGWSYKSLLSNAFSSTDPNTSYTYWPHRGQGREVLPGQKVHVSVAFGLPSYFPRALLPSTFSKPWEFFVHTGHKSKRRWPDDYWNNKFVEMDIFDHSLAEMIVENISREGSDAVMWAHRLTAMTWGDWGCDILSKVPNVTARLLKRIRSFEAKTQAAVVDAISLIEDRVRSHQYQLDNSDHLQVIRELSQNADFLQSFLCDGDWTEKKFASLQKVLGNDDYLRQWILEERTLDYLISALKDEKIAARKSACAVLVGLGVHEDVQRAIMERDDFQTFNASLAAGLDWSLLRVITGIVNHDGSKISRPELVSSLFGRLQECMGSGVATNDEVSSIMSAITELAHHEDVQLLIAAGMNPAFCDYLLFLLDDEDNESRQAAVDIVEGLTKYDSTRLTISKHFITPLVNLLVRTKDPLPVLKIILDLTNYEDTSRGLLGTKFIQIFQRRLSVETGCVYRHLCGFVEELTNHENIISRLIDADFIALSLRRLQDDEPFVRFCASKLLAISTQYYEKHLEISDSILTSCKRILDDDVPYVCGSASDTLVALAMHDDTRQKALNMFLPYLGSLLKDEHLGARSRTVGLVTRLAKYKNTRLPPLGFFLSCLGDLLRDKDEDVRSTTITAVAELVKYGDTRNKVLGVFFPSHLGGLLQDENRYVRSATVGAVAELAKYKGVRTGLLGSFQTYIGSLLKTRDSLIRYKTIVAVTELAAHEDTRAKVLGSFWPYIESLFKDQDSVVRYAMIIAVAELAKHNDTHVKALESFLLCLESVLEDEDPNVRYIIVDTVAKLAIHDDTRTKVFHSFRQYVEGLLKDQNSVVRSTMVGAVSELTQHEDTRVGVLNSFLPCFESLLKDEALDVLRTTVDTVAKLVTHEDTRTKVLHSFLPYIEGLLKHQDSVVCFTTVGAVAELTKYENTRVEVSNSFLPCFDGLLKGESSGVRYTTVETVAELVKHDGTRTNVLDFFLPCIESLLQDKDSNLRYVTLEAVSDLAKNEDTRVKVLDSFLLCLESLVEDEVRLCLKAIETVAGLAKHEDTCIKVLSSFLPHIQDMLKTLDSGVRYATVKAIAGLAAHNATRLKMLNAIIPLLENLLEDEDERVRRHTVVIVALISMPSCQISNSPA